MPTKQAIYQRKIIKHLYFGGTLSCADLSELTRKSVPLTTRVINELIEEGYVVETGLASSTGGRRPQTYALQTDLLYIVTVAMDQLITRIAILDMHNNYVGEIRQVDIVLSNKTEALPLLISHIQEHILQSGIAKEKFVGIGIGMPGFVDVIKGVNHSFLKTDNGQNIAHLIEYAVGVPVLIDNDSSLIALAELKFGSARGRKNAMVINIGWGIGLGMIVTGELFRGYNGFAGEFSHIPLFSNNKMCSCGKSGCLETETSLLVVAQKAIQGLKEGRTSLLKPEHLALDKAESTTKTIIEAAIAGDRFAVELLSDAGYNIGRGIAILIHLFNPELIILSGRGAIAGKLWLTPIQQAINEHCIPKISENTSIEISSLKYQAELIGGAALVMDSFEKASHHRVQHENYSTV